MSDNTIGVIIIIIIILVGIFSGGEIFKGGTGTTESNRANNGEFLDPYGRPYPSDDRPNNVSSGPNRQNLTPEQQLADAKEQLRLLQIQAAKQEELRTASIYKGKVDLMYTANSGASILGYATISSFSSTESVNVTGWKIKSTVTGNELIISGASNLPYSSAIQEGPIILGPMTRLIVSQSASPVGYSFRENKCTGFLGQNMNFYPMLEKRCPDPEDSAPPLSNEFNNACLDYIGRLPRCEVQYSHNLPEDLLTYSCKNYILTKINYNQCVSEHRNDTDFYSNQWRIYPKNTRFFWLDQRDTLQLIDSAGKIVDTFKY